ncbi:MAG: hypothetical protein JOZ54_15305 [Acidobacteria bacterium]|nr:hypothetical protein [Acidobacteriota bacterium]
MKKRPKKASEEELDAQRAAAEELQKQIDALVDGTAPKQRPEDMTFRDFVHQPEKGRAQ